MRYARNCCGVRLSALMECLVETIVAAKTWLRMRSVHSHLVQMRKLHSLKDPPKLPKACRHCPVYTGP